jgi:hypothetical protein
MDHEQIKSDLLSIRQLMERSAKFISLSGLSGILAGVFALIGAGLVYSIWGLESYDASPKLISIALSVLILSVTTAVFLAYRKAKRLKQSLWNPASRALLQAVSLPLVTGGLVLLVFYQQGQQSLLVPMALLFYGMALAIASLFTFKDVWGLGVAQIVLGLAALMIDGYDVLFWSFGFGLLHILYGTIMYLKYDRK